MTEFTRIFDTQARSAPGLALTEGQLAAFETYARLLVEWNAQMNLTAIVDDEGIRTRHFLDSLTVLSVLPEDAGLSLIDVGTGAGFPGLPLKIVRPDLALTLLEATAKKLHFLEAVCAALDITDVQFVHARAEQAGQMQAHREAYRAVVARAVARLPVLVEYLLPLTQRGGIAIAMKGRTAQQETDSAGAAIRKMGGRLNRIAQVELPAVDEPHHLIVIDKVAPTPPAFPRRPGAPTQKPL